MRFIFAIIIVSATLSGACHGQTRTEARTDAKPDIDLPKHRVTTTRGEVLNVVSYTKKEPWYSLVLPNLKKRQVLISSVQSIEGLSEADAIASTDESGESSAADSADHGPRIEARTVARRSPPRRRPRFSADYMSSPMPSGGLTGGTTATGLPLYMGPRGGIYHISSGGNKVYQSH